MMARRLCFLVLLLLLLRPAPAGADKSPVPQGAAQSPAALHGPGAAELEEGLRLLDVSDYRGSLERLEKSLALASAGKDSTVQGWAPLCLARRALEMGLRRRGAGVPEGHRIF